MVLNIGKTLGARLDFYNRLQNTLSLTRVVARPDSMEAIRNRLLSSVRVIVVVTSDEYKKYQTMLDSLPADLPVVYVFLMPLKSMLDMEG